MADSVKPLHQRYDWFDQARGLVVLLLLISMITDTQHGDIVQGDDKFGPPTLNHGYHYYQGHPNIITLIDAGQPIFLVVMGFAAHIAFTSRLNKRGTISALLYGLRRVILLFVCSFYFTIVHPWLYEMKLQWDDLLYKGTFTVLAWGALAAYLSMLLLKRADHRALLALAIMAIHAICYAFPWFDHYEWIDDYAQPASFPFAALNLSALSILGTAFAGWVRGTTRAGFQHRLLPFTALAFVLYYIMDWLQPAQHHDTTTALALLGAGLSGTLLVATYAMDSNDLRFPLLTPLGRNLLPMFILSMLVVSNTAPWFASEAMNDLPFLRVFGIALLPIGLVGIAALLLDHFNIRIRL